ncbi:uncharacterized protein pxnb isoform X1 [Stigmatopora nigra]
MDDLDALLADLESTTSHISKRPVFLQEETPYSIPTGGGNTYQDLAVPPPVPPPPSSEALNGSAQEHSDGSPQQSLGSGQKSSWSRDCSSSPTHFEEDHVYSFPNKVKSSDSAMSTVLGSNLSELDRLLLELNAVQQSSPSFATTEERAPPLPSTGVTHYENGNAPDIRVSPPPQEEPNGNGMRQDENRPNVESLLDDLEGSVPSTSPSPRHSDLDSPSQQQTRISASCATRELDELMASLSDFKPSSPSTSTFAPTSASPSLDLSTCTSPTLSFPTGLELHIDEDSVNRGLSTNRLDRLVGHSPISTLSAGSDLDRVPDEFSSGPQCPQHSLLVLDASARNTLQRSSSSPSSTPSMASVNTVLDHKSSKSPSPAVDHGSTQEAACSPDNLTNGVFSDQSTNLTASVNPKTQSPLPLPSSMSPNLTINSFQTSSPSPLVNIPSPGTFPSSIPSGHPSPQTTRSTPLLLEQQSLDEALDKLLEMSFSQNNSVQDKDLHLPTEAFSLGSGPPELQEELILPMDRKSVQPDMFTCTTNTTTDESVDGCTDTNGDLEWADEDLSLSFHDGADGTMTPYTERLYTDGSVTPMTEASWMDESVTPSTCPGSPDVALDLPLLQTPTMDRMSASGHVGFSLGQCGLSTCFVHVLCAFWNDTLLSG